MDLAGETPLIIRRLIVPLTAALVSLHAGQAGAQGAFPAPLPGQAPAPAASPFPPVSGAPAAGAPAAPGGFPATGAAPVTGSAFERGPAPPTAGPSEACMKAFVPLREEAEKRGMLIKAASDRKAPPEEACKLITSFGQAESKMINFVQSNA